jgi:hypothetical protein
MSKAIDITRDIVVAAFGSLNCNGWQIDEQSGTATADFIQVVYDKVKGIQENEFKGKE